MSKRSFTVADKMAESAAPTTGFDYLRIILSIAILWWHSIGVATGSALLNARLWYGPARFLPASFVPLFFALSGFLVAGSLARNPIHRFVTLRAIRIFPALIVEVVLSAVVIGAVFTTLDLPHYYTSPGFATYLLNVYGIVQIWLPGVFPHNPSPGFMNSQLWTIPFEFECYAALVVLSVAGVLGRRKWFLLAVVLAIAAFTAADLTIWPVDATAHVPGRALVFCFLCGVLIHAFRDKVPYNNIAGVASLIAAVACLELPPLAFLSAIPVAYATVWLGLKRPPAIRFGDLSYGIFLFHFPLLQVVVALSPLKLPWWVLATVATPIAALIASASWNFVEQPVLRRKQSFLGFSDQAVQSAANLLRPPIQLFRRRQSPAR